MMYLKMMKMISKKELKENIERDLKYDIGGTIVCAFMVVSILLFFFNLIILCSFILMTLVFYNSYLITKREKQIMEVLG